MVPNVPWRRAPAARGPRATKKNNYLYYMANQGVLSFVTSTAAQSAVTQTCYLIQGSEGYQSSHLIYIRPQCIKAYVVKSGS